MFVLYSYIFTFVVESYWIVTFSPVNIKSFIARWWVCLRMHFASIMGTRRSNICPLLWLRTARFYDHFCLLWRCYLSLLVSDFHTLEILALVWAEKLQISSITKSTNRAKLSNIYYYCFIYSGFYLLTAFHSLLSIGLLFSTSSLSVLCQFYSQPSRRLYNVIRPAIVRRTGQFGDRFLMKKKHQKGLLNRSHRSCHTRGS